MRGEHSDHEVIVNAGLRGGAGHELQTPYLALALIACCQATLLTAPTPLPALNSSLGYSMSLVN